MLGHVRRCDIQSAKIFAVLREHFRLVGLSVTVQGALVVDRAADETAVFHMSMGSLCRAR